jgi:hypothetical protein
MAIFMLKNTIVLTGSLSALMLMTACSDNKTRNAADSIAGLYKLQIIEKLDSATNTWQEEDFGKGGDSYILYDGLGHMAVQITAKGYKDFAWLTEKQATDQKSLTEHIDSMSCEQLTSAVREFTSSFVYFGDYSINDTTNIITHKRLSSSIPAAWGTIVKRQFSFTGDTLTLSFPDGKKRLKWIRQKQAGL